MKKRLWIWAVFALLVGIITIQRHRLDQFRKENNSLITNIQTLTEGITRYKIRDSLHAAGIGTLQLKIAEYRRLREQDARLIESLKIRLKRVENISRHATESNYQLAVPVHDTVFIDHNRPDTARTFTYRSPYIDLRGTLKNDTVALSLTARDTLVQVIHRIPRRFLFIRYGTKSIRQEIVSRNPHTEIVYSEHIRLTP